MRIELQVPREPGEAGPWEDASELGPHPIASMVDAMVGDEVLVETTANPFAKLGNRVTVLRHESPTATLGPVVLIRAVRVPRAGHRPGPHVKVVVRASNEGIAVIHRPDVDEGRAVSYGRTRRARELRGDVIARYRRLHGNDVLIGPGHYYGTIEVQFLIQGTAGGEHGPGQAVAAVVVPSQGSPVVDAAFTLGIGDTSTTWFGGPHVLTAADTNLQNPSTTLFADEVFIIEALSARVRGVRVAYGASDIARMLPYPTGPAVGSPVYRTLTGQQLVMDLAGQVLPAEMWNQYSDELRLAKTLAECASLHFTWREPGIGGGGRVNDVLIDSFLNIPGSGERNLRRTSGGAQVLDLPSGYIWCLDKNWQYDVASGGNGLFDAELHLNEPATFTFVPIRVFGSNTVVGTPITVLPTGLALYWEVRLFGWSLTPARREYRARDARRRA
jgi:hypothetical protein